MISGHPSSCRASQAVKRRQKLRSPHKPRISWADLLLWPRETFSRSRWLSHQFCFFSMHFFRVRSPYETERNGSLMRPTRLDVRILMQQNVEYWRVARVRDGNRQAEVTREQEPRSRQRRMARDLNTAAIAHVTDHRNFSTASRAINESNYPASSRAETDGSSESGTTWLDCGGGGGGTVYV